jgi:hypothetical protein
VEVQQVVKVPTEIQALATYMPALTADWDAARGWDAATDWDSASGRDAAGSAAAAVLGKVPRKDTVKIVAVAARQAVSAAGRLVRMG